jgi:hypothetical protein
MMGASEAPLLLPPATTRDETLCPRSRKACPVLTPWQVTYLRLALSHPICIPGIGQGFA